MYKQIQCYNTLKNWKKCRDREREREIPKENEKVFLGLWRNWSEAEQTVIKIWSDPSAQLGVFRHCTTQKQKKWILKITFLRNANSWIKYVVNIDKK